MSKKCCKKDKPCKGCPRRAKQAGIQCAVDDCQMAMIVVSVNVF